MNNTVFLNGNFVAEQEARISPMDRGFLFGDAVYEVLPVYNGKAFCLEAHLQRLQNSCDGIRLGNPYSFAEWREHISHLLQHNQAQGLDQSLYIQVTRGSYASRDHLFPSDAKATTFMFSKPLPKADQRLLNEGVKLITAEETRWQKCHLKTTSLVANVLHKQMAKDENADEAILIRDGYAQECSASNFFIVSNGAVLTPPKSQYLLPGITRDHIIDLLKHNDISISESPLTLNDLRQADEIWVTSSIKEVTAATELDGKPVGDGKPGQLWKIIYQLFQQSK